MNYPVIRASSNILVHVPDLLVTAGTTQTMERKINANSEYLSSIKSHLRSFEQAVDYPPNQVFIGNELPDFLAGHSLPWYENLLEHGRHGDMGEIFPQDEFLGVLKIVDTFGLVMLQKEFSVKIARSLKDTGLFSEEELFVLQEGFDSEEIEAACANGAIALIENGKEVGAVKAAHQMDENLTAHVMLENLCCKASGVLAVKKLLVLSGIPALDIDYVIECSEEACGDMNQRGGGNFAKSLAEKSGCLSASGSDVRSFCAGPVHAIIFAASLVQSGICRNVLVAAGGAVAKLGMNGKDHSTKGMPLLEDLLGGFAILISENDGIHPVIRTDGVGRHTVGTGSSPQSVMESLVTMPLEKIGLKIMDIDKYSVEMQNPEITKAAGAGDVPLANYKMIAALAVKRGEMERADIDGFVSSHGMPGFAPTQGHIPSGVPYMGFAIKGIMEGKIDRVMIIGKGSLFLGRLTNLFDGTSFVIEKNSGKQPVIKDDRKELKRLLSAYFRKMATDIDSESPEGEKL